MTGFPRTLRAGAVIALLAGLAACGGGNNDENSVEMSGTVSGLVGGSLTLTNGLTTVNIPVGSTTFTFPNRMNIGLSYFVSVVKAPDALSCLIVNGSGTAGLNLTNNIAVTCAPKNYLGGTVTGLKGEVTVTNGDKTQTIKAGATTWRYDQQYTAGVAYGITVLTQPPGQTCTIQNGIGTMPTTEVTNVAINCI